MTVRIGFIGAGGIARAHLASLMTDPGAEVVALCDLSEDVVEETRSRVDEGRSERDGPRLTAPAYSDIERMLARERPDAVYVCVPPFAHGEPEEALIEAGVPMLVEKPVALDLSLAIRLGNAIRRRDLLCATGYQTRYASYVQRARELMAGKQVGMAVVTRFGRTPGTPWYHRQDKSGGQVTEMATHQVDLLRYLVGEIKTVYAAAATRINDKIRPDYDIFDVNCSTWTFDNGAVANFSTNFIAVPGSPFRGPAVDIFCEGTTLSLQDGLRAASADGVEEVPVEENPIATEDRLFVRAVGEGRPDLIASDYENGVRNLAVTLANDRSARTGKAVDVAESLTAGSADAGEA